MTDTRSKYRPARVLVWISAAYLAALAVFFLCGAHTGFSLLLLGGVVGVLSAAAFHPRFPLGRGLLLAMAAATVLAFGAVRLTLSAYRAFAAEDVRTVVLSGTVKTLSYASDRGAGFVLSVDTMDGERVRGCVRVSSEGDVCYASPGEQITCTVTLGDPALLADYETHRLYDFADRIYAYAEITDPASFAITGRAHGFSAFCDALTVCCQRQLLRYLDPDAAALSMGILLGDKSALSPAVLRDFRRVGLSHVLAVSGLHLSVLLGSLQRFLRGVDKRLRLVLLLGFLFVFVGMTGFSPSILRAGIMWMMTAAAFCFGGNNDSITALFFAALLICIVTPTSIVDIGFLLSCTATLGILLFTPPTEQLLSRLPQTVWGRILQWILSQCGITLAATLFTLPVMLFVFGEISLLAPLANVLLQPLLSLLLSLVPLFLVTSVLPFGLLASFLGGCISGASTLICALCARLAPLPFAVVGVHYPFLVPVFVLFVLCACAVGWLSRHKRYALLHIYPVYFAFCLIFAAMALGYGILTRDRVIIETSVYKNNDITTVIADGNGILIDNSDGSLTSARHGWEQLSDDNLTQLHALLLTHYHKKHIPTLARLAREIVIETLLLPLPETAEEQEIYDRLCRTAEHTSPPIAVLTYRRGVDTLMLGSAEIETLPLAYLERSVQPLIGFSVSGTADDGSLSRYCALSPTAYDPEVLPSFAAARDALAAHADVLALGTHGPRIKDVYGADSLAISSPSVLIYATETVKTFCHPALLQSAETVFMAEGREQITVVFD